MKQNDRKINIKALIAAVVCIAVVSGLILADFLKSRQEYTATDIAMNTVINLRLYGKNGEKNASEIFDEIKSVETSLLSRYDDGSDVSRINKAGQKAVAVSPEVFEIINTSAEISEKCGGVFDITVGKITELWGFGTENPQVPSKDKISALLPYVDSGKLKIAGSEITLGDNQAIDLGAVGKGAACDIVRTQLNSMSTDSAVISVGGSLLLYGKRDFSIGIVNPEDDKKSMGTLKLSDTCISTSGDYEQFFEIDGRKYHHILNARTGYPADSHLKSVTVVCKSGVISDALSTACYIMGYGDKALSLLKEYDAEAVFISKDGIVRCTDGLKKSFTLTDDSFTIGS